MTSRYSTGGERVVEGDIAHDAADSGNPIKIGGKAYTGNLTAVGSGDRVEAHFTEYGDQAVVIFGQGAVEDGVDRRGVGSRVEATTTDRALAVLPYAFAPDASVDRLRSVGDTAGSGLGALMVSPTGHAHNSVTADEQILGAAGKLHTITVHDVTTGGVLTVYDSTAESGTVIATLTLVAGEGFVSLHYDVHCGTGLYMGYDTNLVGAFTVSYSV